MIRMHLGMPLLSFTAQKKGAKAPAVPDPNVVSQAQTQSNKDTAAYQNAIDHGNTSTPFGSQTFTGRVDPTTGATVYDQNISVSPDVQKLIDLQAQQDLSLGNTSQKMLGTVDSAYSSPADYSSLPAIQSGVKGGPIQTSLDTSNLPALYGANDLEGARKAVSDALYQRQTAYLDPQYQQKQQALDAKLANQGITQGSEAYKNAMDDFARAQAFDYGQARDSAIAGGGDEMTRLANIALANRGEQFGERSTAGGFANAAQAQQYGQNLSSANQTNAARAQALQDLLTRRNQPLNEFNALRSASQVNVPQFSNPQNAQVQPTSTSNDIWNAFNGQMGIYNANTSSNNSLLSGLMGLGGQLGSAWIQYSDARVKSRVKRIGLLPQGVGLYEYEYTGDPKHEKQVGVMAQEVERDDPAAVSHDESGLKRVDYARVLARALEEYDAAA